MTHAMWAGLMAIGIVSAVACFVWATVMGGVIEDGDREIRRMLRAHRAAEKSVGRARPTRPVQQPSRQASELRSVRRIKVERPFDWEDLDWVDEEGLDDE